jgi:putative ABC transport system permease protein
MTIWIYTLRELRRRPGRTVLTFLGIALGLAVIVATRLAIQTARAAYGDMADGLAGQPALEVVSTAQGVFDADWADTLRGVPGVAAILPCLDGVVALASNRGNLSVRLLGIDLADPEMATLWPLRAGQLLEGANEALADADLAQSLGVTPGCWLRLWAASGPAKVRIAGILQPRASALGGVLVVRLTTARRLLGVPRGTHRLHVLLSDRANADAVTAALVRRLPAGLTVQSPRERDALARAALLSAEQGLDALGIMALVAAAFVILNTFQLNLGQRSGQFATLRALGATPGQVARLLLREAALLGIVGTLAGCVAGAVLAVGLLHLVGQFLGVPLPALRLTAGPFLVALVLGPVTTLAAALLPAWRAGHVPVLQALARCHHPANRPLGGWSVRLGLVLLVLGAMLGTGLCRGWFSPAANERLLPATLAVLLMGGVTALPALSSPLLRLLEVLPLGVEPALAGRQLRRHCGRTARTAGVLFLALAIAVAFGNSLRGVVRDLRRWYGQTIVADFLVRGSMTDTAFTLAAALPQALGEEIGRLAPGATVDRLAFVPALAGGQPTLVLARTFTPGYPLALDLREGDETSVRHGLARGDAVLGTGLAARLSLHCGDTITLATGAEPRVVRVAGIANEYAVGGLTLYLEWGSARRFLRVPGVHAFLVRAGPGGSATLGQSLRGFCAARGLLLQSNAELGALVGGLVGRVTGVLWALMALAFIVASLGIVNTLTLNVHEQTQEFGMLRALGLGRRGVCRVVLWQGVLLWGVSALPGTLAGLALAYLINRGGCAAAVPPIPFRVDAVVVAGASMLALGTALVAALLPARRANGVSVVQAARQS